MFLNYFSMQLAAQVARLDDGASRIISYIISCESLKFVGLLLLICCQVMLVVADVSFHWSRQNVNKRASPHQATTDQVLIIGWNAKLLA